MNALRNYLTDKDNGVSVESVETDRVAELESDDLELEQAMVRNHEQLALAQLEKAIGLPKDSLQITEADRLRGAIVEAAVMLREHAPGRALAVLEGAMKL
jgi:hypothetical protein